MRLPEIIQIHQHRGACLTASLCQGNRLQSQGGTDFQPLSEKREKSEFHYYYFYKCSVRVLEMLGIKPSALCVLRQFSTVGLKLLLKNESEFCVFETSLSL